MKEKFRYEAPEGGWGILICIAAAIPFVTSLGSIPSFGLVFGGIVDTSAISIITSTYFFCMSTASLFTDQLFKNFGLRRIALLAGITYTIGCFLQIFVRSTLDLTVTFGVLQGTAYGIIVPAFNTVFNEYFVKKRVIWMGFAQVLNGILIVLYPVVVEKLLKIYGFRGCLAILFAISANSICGMMVLHPVKWHMRKVLITDYELIEKPQPSLVIIEQLPSNASNQNSPLMIKPQKLNKILTLKGSTLKKKNRSSSIISLANYTSPVVVCEASPSMEGQNSVIDNGRSVWQMVVDSLDLSLLKNPIYLNICFGETCAFYSDLAFFMLEPMYLIELDFSKHDISRIISIGAAADLISRISLSFFAMFFQTSSRNIYLVGALLSIISRFVFLEVHDCIGVACLTAVMGFLRSWMHVPMALVFAEYLPKERFTSGFGLYVFIQGYSAFAIGPIIGYIRDVTKSWVVIFHVLNGIMALGVLPWILEFAYFKFIKKQKLNIPIECE